MPRQLAPEIFGGMAEYRLGSSSSSRRTALDFGPAHQRTFFRNSGRDGCRQLCPTSDRQLPSCAARWT